MGNQITPTAKAQIITENEILLVKNSHRDDGDWSLPGATVKPGEGYGEALKRKLNTIGIHDIEIGNPIGIYTKINSNEKVTVIVLSTTIGLKEKVEPKTKNSPIVNFGWFTLSETADLNLDIGIQEWINGSSGFWTDNKNQDQTISDKKLLSFAQLAAQRTVKSPPVEENTDRTLIGAAVLTSADEIYIGEIIETRDKIQTIHAEQLAIAKAISEGKGRIEKLAVFSTDRGVWPCGACLQFLYEFSNNGNPTIIVDSSEGTMKRTRLSELYSRPWPPDLHQEKK